MSDHTKTKPDTTELAELVSESDETIPSPIEIVVSKGMPLDASEADVLEQAHLEPFDEEEERP